MCCKQVGENKLQAAGWYHGALKRPTGEKRLMSPGTRYGDFMVRESGSVDGYIALSVRADNKVLHYLIHEKFGRFFVGDEPKLDQMFASIQNLITESKAKCVYCIQGLHRPKHIAAHAIHPPSLIFIPQGLDMRCNSHCGSVSPTRETVNSPMLIRRLVCWCVCTRPRSSLSGTTCSGR